MRHDKSWKGELLHLTMPSNYKWKCCLWYCERKINGCFVNMKEKEILFWLLEGRKSTFRIFVLYILTLFLENGKKRRHWIALSGKKEAWGGLVGPNIEPRTWLEKNSPLLKLLEDQEKKNGTVHPNRTHRSMVM